MTRRFRRLFFDMDGVLVDFDAFMKRHGLTGDQVKRLAGAYRDMPAIEGAIAGMHKVMSLAGMYGFEVWIATKPPTGIAFAYSDKAAWVFEHLPALRRNIIMTHDKGLLGDEDDVLVDDRPHRANCHEFRGALIHFGPAGTVPHWPALVDRLHRIMRHPDGVREANAIEEEASDDDVNEARRLLGLGNLPVPRIATRETATPIARVELADTAPLAAGETLTVTMRPVLDTRNDHD
jgi:5'(3')-deoxyribonucleotidase